MFESAIHLIILVVLIAALGALLKMVMTMQKELQEKQNEIEIYEAFTQHVLESRDDFKKMRQQMSILYTQIDLMKDEGEKPTLDSIDKKITEIQKIKDKHAQRLN